MRKMVGFSEVMFCNEYYIDGVDVFKDENRKFLGKVDIDLRMRVSYSKLNGVDLYEVKGTRTTFKICISKVKDFYIISYYDSKEFYKVSRFRRSLLSSAKKNRELLEKIAITKSKEIDNPNIIYSSDNRRRACIENKNGMIMLLYQYLEVRDYISYHFREDVNSNNYWSWELGTGVSYFADIEDAKKEALEWVKDEYNEPLIYEDVEYLWSEELSKKETVLAMLKYMGIVLCIFTFPWMIFPILGLSNWFLMVLILFIDAFSIGIASFALWLQPNSISYYITDKSIISFSGIERETPFENIESIKLVKSKFNKNKASIKFKLKKGLAISFNFNGIKDYEEAYKILKEKVH